jgi:hypothetical protein
LGDLAFGERGVLRFGDTPFAPPDAAAAGPLALALPALRAERAGGLNGLLL